MMTLIKENKLKRNRKTKSIFVLLTRFDDGGSKLMSSFTGCYYTHASIGLEEDMNTFYSFIYKGFIVEEITRYLKADREPFPCELYRIEVPSKVYKRVKKRLKAFVNARKKFSYSRFGLAMCLFGIPHKEEKKRYFCSHFVAEILNRCGAAIMKKRACLYLPGDFRNIERLNLAFEGNLLTFARYYGILPCPA